MAKSGRKKGKAKTPKPRNPFAGRPRSGAGFHDDARYGKKDRRKLKQEIGEEQESVPADPDSADS